MILLQELTQDYRQQYTVTNEDNVSFLLTLTFVEQQQSWFVDIEYGDFILKSYRLVPTSNLLRQWKNILPFGLMVTVTDLQDPFLISDLTSGRVSIFALTAAEVANIETQFYSPV